MNREMNVNFTHLGVDVFTETLTIPTYRLGEPDPNPPLFAKGVRNVYPYSRRDSFTEEIEDRAYDAVKLVSPWIEATILQTVLGRAVRIAIAVLHSSSFSS
jgi:hypothetical protein